MTILLTRTIDSDTVPTYYISDDGRIIAQLTADQMDAISADYQRMLAEDRDKAEAARAAKEKAEHEAAKISRQRTITVGGEEWLVQGHPFAPWTHDIHAYPVGMTYDTAPFVVQVEGWGGALPWTVLTSERQSWGAKRRLPLAGANGNARRFSTIEKAIKAIQTHVALTTADQADKAG